MSDCGCELEVKSGEEARTLWILLCINGFMFVVEFSFGWVAQSAALISDSMDMFADAMVYAIGLYVVSRGAKAKAHSALLNGVLQSLLGIAALLEVVRRFFVGSEPRPSYMVAVATVALIANVVCLLLLAKHREGEVHMRATWICSRNDVIANVGVIVAGVLVALSQSQIPDLAIGMLIAFVVLNGGAQILREGWAAFLEARRGA
ncbi:MAG: cation transporter [Deltaproteobacteria bacterium]|nr:cation transporter [Deltaproteobacteria bacterium]